jgi:site-specific DNA-methyltransferase (adenine-specific)
MGTLYYGDNLDILRRHLGDETVDLIYLDPPLNSAQDDNAFFHEKDGTAAASQIKAFEDTWHWDTALIWLAAHGIWRMDPPKAYD